MATPQQTGSQAVERASALLSVIVESGAPRTFSSLVAELGLAKSTTSRLLQALERSRLVHRDRAGAFRPGALFSLRAARPLRARPSDDGAPVAGEPRDGEPRGAARQPGGDDRPARQPVPGGRDELGRGRRARPLHG